MPPHVPYVSPKIDVTFNITINWICDRSLFDFDPSLYRYSSFNT